MLKVQLTKDDTADLLAGDSFNTQNEDGVEVIVFPDEMTGTQIEMVENGQPITLEVQIVGQGRADAEVTPCSS